MVIFISMIFMSILYVGVMCFLGVFIIVAALALLNLVAVVIPRWVKSLSESPKKRSLL